MGAFAGSVLMTTSPQLVVSVICAAGLVPAGTEDQVWVFSVGVGGVVQRLRQQRHVERGVGHRQALDVAALPRHVREAPALGELPGPGQHRRRAIDAHHPARPARRLDREIALAAADVDHVERRQQQAQGPRPRRPAAPGHELTAVAGVGPGVYVEVLAAQPPHFLNPGVVGPNVGNGLGARELGGEELPQGRVVALGTGQPVVDVDAVAFLAHQAGVFQQAEVARDARLRQAEDPRQLRHVEAVDRQRPEEAQAGRVAEHAEQGRGLEHIDVSMNNDTTLTGRAPSPAAGAPGQAVPTVRAGSDDGRRLEPLLAGVREVH